MDRDRTGSKGCAQRYPQSPASNKPPPLSNRPILRRARIIRPPTPQRGLGRENAVITDFQCSSKNIFHVIQQLSNKNKIAILKFLFLIKPTSIFFI